ncbi:MAG: MFS transporter [Dehalococcoidia bacterium]|nr:MFS transporter [Dehalococcoidia bacterium]
MSTTEAAPGLPPQSRLPAFQSRDFRLLFTNSFFAAASNWAMILGRGWLVFELTDSAAAVGLVTMAGMISNLFAPVAGAVADRVDRRRMAVLGGVIGALSALALGVIAFAGAVATWHVVALALTGGMGRAVSRPAETAMVPNLVPPEHLLNAIAMTSISVHGSRIAGPLVGGILLEMIGAGAVFLLSAALSTAGIAALMRIAPSRSAVASQAGLSATALVRRTGRDIRDGLRYIESDPRVVMLLVLVTAHCALTMAFDSLMPMLSTQLGGGSRTYTAILIAIGTGAVAGTLALSLVRSQRIQGSVMALSGALSGAGMVVLGLAPTPLMAILGAALAGGAQATYMALSATLVQQIVPDTVRGRVMSIYIMLTASHMAFLNFGFGWLADGIGIRVLLVGPGLLWTAVFAGAIFGLPDLKHLLRHGTFRAPAVAATAAGGD